MTSPSASRSNETIVRRVEKGMVRSLIDVYLRMYEALLRVNREIGIELTQTYFQVNFGGDEGKNEKA